MSFAFVILINELFFVQFVFCTLDMHFVWHFLATVQSPHPCITLGMKLFSLQSSSFSLFNQANGCNIYCIDPSSRGFHNELTTIPRRAAIPHFLFFFPPPTPSRCPSGDVWISTKREKSKHLPSLPFYCSTSQISHLGWLMCNLWVAKLLTCKEMVYISLC